MRVRKTTGGLTVNAIAGSHVIFLGLDIKPPLRAGLRGFAVRRQDKTEGETYWMRGAKVFASLIPHPVPGIDYSSREQPFQTFQWSDYSAKPNHSYVYEVHALYGAPGALAPKAVCKVAIATEGDKVAQHIVNFNRGSPATQEYARRFQNQLPSIVGEEAYKWLSRGLQESILDFIARATDETYGLKGAFYEFQWQPILMALKQASAARRVTVSVVFDDINNSTGPHTKNEAAINLAGLGPLMSPRTNGTLMHNKFLVLTQKQQGIEKPIAVLFGSTNLTENGIFGHANSTHIIEDADIAAKYLALHDMLLTDPATTAASPYKDWIENITPAPKVDALAPMTAIFSPRHGDSVLKWYGEVAANAQGGLFMTFAFGMNEVFKAVYARTDGVLRVGLMEKEWNGANKDAQIQAIRAIQALPNVVIAIGNRIPLNNFDQWLLEIDHIADSVHVHWVHLKFMLVDPLSQHPVVITGSANFSAPSTSVNDENMVVIADNLAVADIYFGEYMRLYSHYAFREAVNIWMQRHPGAAPSDFRQGFLVEGDADWTADYFDASDTKARRARRLYFAGSGGLAP
jgi:phosphatidylserine/phosphatidylglycerophosphate/cardiolipin synthase-like enzyme